tara:strand:+ start:32 stop:208 length:177 start_codon:yes stop_codon:yes gene_type:complete
MKSKIRNMKEDLEKLRKAWGVEKVLSPFITKIEVEKFWEKQKEIKDLELKLKKLKKKI